jgi:hypothetical protein
MTRYVLSSKNLSAPEVSAGSISRLELLRYRINDENYVRAAVHRLAMVLSNELMNITQEGARHERQRKRRK